MTYRDGTVGVTHRPPQEMIVDYATGALPQPQALAVAVHAALCPETVVELETLDAVGGAMLSGLPPAPMESAALEQVVSRLGVPDLSAPGRSAPGRSVPGRQADPDRRGAGGLPAPLRKILDGETEAVDWRRMGRAVESAVIPSEVEGFSVRLLRIKAGQAVPKHTHDGQEITLCLSGGYRDGRQRFARGDFQLADATDNHQPVADESEDCIVLAVVERRIRLTGPVGRLINPFIRL